MKIRFKDQPNSDIQHLVDLAWANAAPHVNEIFQVAPQDADAVFDFINDVPEPDDLGSTEETATSPPILLQLPTSSPQTQFKPPAMPKKYPVVSVDCGIVDLGEFVGGGVAFAIRGTAVITCDDNTLFLKYNTGPILVDSSNQIELFRFIGKRLGREDIYLKKNASGAFVLDEAILGNTNQIEDRFRNFVERIIQEDAIGVLKQNGGGLLLIDGALPSGTFDTPAVFMNEMLRFTSTNGIDVVALSKKTRIVVNSKPLSSMFDESPTFVGYAALKDIIDAERKAMLGGRTAENVTAANEIFAVRFGLGPPPLTFRADVHNSTRHTAPEVLDLLVANAQIFGCYPRTLIDAHQQSSFMFQDVQLLTADLVARTGAQPKGDQSMEWMFQPFGAYGK